MFNVMFKLKDFFKQYKKDYIISFITMISSNLLSVVIPYLIGLLVDHIVSENLTYMRLLEVSALFLLCLIAAYLLEFVWSFYLFTGAAKLQRNMRERLMAHFLEMRSIFYEKFRVGDLMARATEDVRAISDTAGYGMMVLMNATLFLTTIIGMMGFTVSWRLTIASLLPLSILAYVFDKLGNKVEKRFQVAQTAFSDLNNDVLEVVDGIRVIRAYVKESDYIDKFRTQTESMLEKNNKVAEINALFMPLVKIIVGASNLIAFGYGAFLVLEGALTVGDMVAFQMYLGMILWPMISIGELTNVLRQGSASMVRVDEVFATNDEMEKGGTKVIETADEIKMHGLNFKYPSSQEVNLSKIDLAIPKGKTLGIIGKTGAGKTTLLRQILREYPLGEGIFRYGEENILTYEKHQIQRLIGYVPQDHILFSRSVRENIAFGKGETNDEEIMNSLRIAAFEEDLLNMEKGLDTMIGEKGVSISGGQKQRISLARALIKQPEILILDDALSAVDAKTEQKIIKNIQRVRAGETTLISTHRLSAVRQADEIIVLEKGQIVERGSHEELLQKKGWYYEQYLRQELKEGGEKC